MGWHHPHDEPEAPIDTGPTGPKQNGEKKNHHLGNEVEKSSHRRLEKMERKAGQCEQPTQIGGRRKKN